ncbi:MAG: histidinol dehydrogenase [Rhodothermales bacterium]
MLPIVSFEDRRDKLPRIFDRGAVFSDEIDAAVSDILRDVRERRDEALLDLTERFDGVRPARLRISTERLAEAYSDLDPELRDIFSEAASNIRRFHEKQVRSSWFSDEDDGVMLGQRFVPLDRAGVYVPGGTAAYPSTVLMSVIPAQVAGVRDIQLTSPPGDDGEPHPFVLAAAHFLGLDAIYAVGGAQAIGALAYGTQTIPRVDKIVGPGNVYVAAAKKQVYGQVDIDSIAGPSEIVVLADDGADSGFAAADLLSQAEHDPRASAVLVTTDAAFAARVRERAIEMAADLPRREIVEASLADFGACIVADTMEQAVDVVNELAPEHLELLVRDPEGVLGQVRHAGAIFLGPYSPEPVGDYFAGPNHVLPTGGTARYASALDVTDFLRRQSIVAYTRERLAKTGARIATFARAEDLEAHARAVEIRIDDR